MVRSYISTFLRLYGVFETKWLFEVIRKHDIPAESAKRKSTAEESTAEEKYGRGKDGGEVEKICRKKETGHQTKWHLSNEMLEKVVVRLKEESENFGLEADICLIPI